MKFYIIPLVFLLLSLEASGQFTNVDSTKFKMRFNIGFGAIASENPFSQKVFIDPYIDNLRTVLGGYYTGEVTDQPHPHGAIYSIFGTKTTFISSIDFYLNLLVEHRGASYGANDLNNIVVVPQIYGQVIDTLNRKKEPIAIRFLAGDLIDFKVGNGLQVYNLDVQGESLKIKYKNYYVQADHIGDVSNGVGLALEELLSFGAGLELSKHHVGLSFDLNSNNRRGREWFPHLSLTYNYQPAKFTELYFQAGSRWIDGSFRFSSSAVLIGADYSFSSNRFRLTLNPELRFYTEKYNQDYRSFQPLYRDLDNPDDYANTVGRYLYPLKNYYYSFSQWAVFTEYPRQYVFGAGLVAEAQYRIGKNFKTKLLFDYLGIKAERSGY
ncbi:MAG: hypothetical protein AAF502_16555, partial [Bacteroidota bacterium]